MTRRHGSSTTALWGDPSGPRLWSDLDGVLNGTWGDLPVRAVAVDTGGHHTKMAYEFCRTRLARRIWRSRTRRPRHPGLAPPPDPHATRARSAVHRRRRCREGRGLRPPETDRTRPRRHPLPRRLDADYFRQLTAERVVTRFEKGRPIRSWQPKRDGERNEALDTFVYAHAALHGLISMGCQDSRRSPGTSRSCQRSAMESLRELHVRKQNRRLSAPFDEEWTPKIKLGLFTIGLSTCR